MDESIDWENWSVQDWLKSISLSKYEDDFIDNGYDTPDLVAELKKEDLDAIGVTKKKDRSTLFTQAKKLKELVSKDICSVTKPPPLVFAAASTSPGICNQPPNSPLPPGDSYSEPWSSYSEPWGATQNGTGNGSTNGITSEMVESQRKHARNVSGGQIPPVKQTKGKHGKPPPSPKTPNVAELPVFKRDGAGPTTLQLKLMIRKELQKDQIVLSEYPYNEATQDEHQHLLVDLAEDYSHRLQAESLGVYDALLDVWTQANNTTEFAVPVKQVTTSVGKEDVDHSTMTGDPTDNYDEPFDSQAGKQGMAVVKPLSREGSPKKSRTLPSGGSGFQSYEEPFDSVVPSESSPKSPKNLIKKNSSSTLPSPQVKREGEIERIQVESKSKKKKKRLSTEKSPRNSPVSSPKSSPKPLRRFFRKKDKPRSHSVRDFDGSKGDKKKALISFPERSKDDSWSKKKHGSAENLTEKKNSPVDMKSNRISVGAIVFNGSDTTPPPLPPPRRPPKSTSPTSSESEDSPFPKKKYNGKEFKKFVTPPTLKRNEALKHGNSCSSSEGEGNSNLLRVHSHTGSDIEVDRAQDSDEDGKRWLKTSQSFDQLNTIGRKKSKKIWTLKASIYT